ALRQSLVNAAKKHGATFIKGDAVLIHENNNVKGVHGNAETVTADQVIVTEGAGANELLEPLGVNCIVTFQKEQM
ncbi:FAD-dependent oxidoreductase, partial [Bacillus pseudomycoides]|uniref:FAD-dependent oxidoreductase n=1 Tax=Bacillus pseudomycoides TaxID=64104 RepID=UPI00284F6546